VKTVIGDSLFFPNPQPKDGWSVWIENGVWFTAPTVDGQKFGGHLYDNGGFEMGITNCLCGCYMGREQSYGPVDPFGPCPQNPKH